MHNQQCKSWYRSRHSKSVKPEYTIQNRYLYSNLELNHLANVQNIFNKYQFKNQLDINRLKDILILNNISFSEPELQRLFPHIGRYYKKIDFKQFQNALQENCVFGRALLNLNFLTERQKQIKELQKQDQNLSIERKTEIMKELLDYEIHFIQEYTKNYQQPKKQLRYFIKYSKKKNNDGDYLYDVLEIQQKIDKIIVPQSSEDQYISNMIKESQEYQTYRSQQPTIKQKKQTIDQYQNKNPQESSTFTDTKFPKVEKKGIFLNNIKQSLIKDHTS